MKPHPRIRKTIKWGGATATVVLVVVWVGTMLYGGVRWRSTTGHWIELSSGRLMIAFEEPTLYPGFGWTAEPAELRSSSILPYVVSKQARWYAYLPLWIPALLAAFAAAATWMSEIARARVSRRRVQEGCCPMCNYKRVGLAVDAKCPECGSTPA